MSVAVLASGSGSILKSVLAAGIDVAVVVTDRACRAVEVGGDAGVPVVVIERGPLGPAFDRGAFTRAVVEAVDGVDVVAMAGFMTVLTGAMFERFPTRVLNTHPSLLPAFPGAHAVRDALAYGVKVTGCTVHVATVEVDHGPILAQEAVAVLPGDDETLLHERIKVVERRLYPRTIKEFRP